MQMMSHPYGNKPKTAQPGGNNSRSIGRTGPSTAALVSINVLYLKIFINYQQVVTYMFNRKLDHPTVMQY